MSDPVRDGVVPRAGRVGLGAMVGWLRAGWVLYRRTALISSAFAGLFAAVGLLGLYLLVHYGVTPMAYPWAGGFLLVGPSLLCGFFHVAERSRAGEAVSFRSLLAGFRRATPPLWAISFLTGFLLLIWLTDAAVIYGLYFGTAPVPLASSLFSDPVLRENLILFVIGSSVGGGVLALIVLAIGAFSVPLIFFRRLGLADAVGASVRAVAGNFVVMAAWGLLLAGSIIAVVLIFIPAFVVLFPVLAYASERAYRDVWEG